MIIKIIVLTVAVVILCLFGSWLDRKADKERNEIVNYRKEILETIKEISKNVEAIKGNGK